MKNKWKIWTAVVLAILIPVAAFGVAGTWSTNKFLYIIGYEEKGQTAWNKYSTGMQQVDTRLGREVWIGDPKTGYDTLSGAIAALNSSGEDILVHISAGNHSITSNTTSFSNIAFREEPGAVITITAATWTIQGSFEAGAYDVFPQVGADPH